MQHQGTDSIRVDDWVSWRSPFRQRQFGTVRVINSDYTMWIWSNGKLFKVADKELTKEVDLCTR